MTTREKLLQVAEDLPAHATIEDAMERLLFLAKVERGLKELDEGKGIPQSVARDRLKQWLG